MTLQNRTALLLFPLVSFFALAAPKPPVKVDIKNLQGKTVGTAAFTEADTGGVKLDVNITALKPGSYAFHIHQKPICDAKEEFNTAGLRFDPTGEFYGTPEHKHRTGPSAGDPQAKLEVGQDGTGHGTYLFPKLTLGDDERSVVGGDGHAILFHGLGPEDPDRVACGVIARPK